MKAVGFLSVFLLSFMLHANESELLKASGFGTADLSAVKVPAQAQLMARRAAIVDAQRNLAEQIRGVRLTGGTMMEEYEISSDIVATRVKGLLKGAFEIEQKITRGEGSVTIEIVLAICMNNESDRCKYKESLAQIEQDYLRHSGTN